MSTTRIGVWLPQPPRGVRITKEDVEGLLEDWLLLLDPDEAARGSMRTRIPAERWTHYVEIEVSTGVMRRLRSVYEDATFRSLWHDWRGHHVRNQELPLIAGLAAFGAVGVGATIRAAALRDAWVNATVAKSPLVERPEAPQPPPTLEPVDDYESLFASPDRSYLDAASSNPDRPLLNP